MPFRIVHAPSAASVGGLSYRTGQGEFQKYLAEQQFRRDATLLDAQQRQQGMELQLLQQALGAANQDRRDRTRFGMDMLSDELGRRRSMEDMALKRGWAVEDRAADEAFRRSLGEESFANQKELYGMQAAEIAARQAEDDERNMLLARKRMAWESVANGSHAYSAADRNEMARLRSEKKRIMAADDWPEDVKAAKIADLDQRYSEIEDNPDPLRPDEREVPFDQQFAKETVELKMPDGSIKRVGRDRSGAWREVFEWDADAKGDPAAMAKAEERKSLVEAYKIVLKTNLEAAALAAKANMQPMDPKATEKIIQDSRAAFPGLFADLSKEPGQGQQQGQPGIVSQLQAAGQFGEMPAQQPSAPQPAGGMAPQLPPQPAAAPQVAADETAPQAPALPPQQPTGIEQKEPLAITAADLQAATDQELINLESRYASAIPSKPAFALFGDPQRMMRLELEHIKPLIQAEMARRAPQQQGGVVTEDQLPEAQNYPHPQSAQDFAQLPSGALYIGRDRVLKRKP